MNRFIRFIKRVKISDRKLLILILLILVTPYVYKFTHIVTNDYFERKKMINEQILKDRVREKERQKQDEIVKKLNNLLDKYSIHTATPNGLSASIQDYLEAKKDIHEKNKEYGFTCENPPKEGDFISRSNYFKNAEESLANMSVDSFLRDCKTVRLFVGEYEQFVKERASIEQLISENKESLDQDVKDYVKLLEFDMSKIDLIVKLQEGVK